MTYTLYRTLPNGAEKATTGLASRRKAATAAAFVINDNAGPITRQEFNALAARVHDAPLGEVVLHEPTGYSFRTVAE